MKIFVTGAAGFIGAHVAHRLIDRGDEVLGIDNLNDYYDVTLKQAGIAAFTQEKSVIFDVKGILSLGAADGRL